MNLRRIWLFCFFFGIYCCSCSDSSRNQVRHVLVVHSYENYYAGYPEFNELISRQFKKEKIHTDIRTIYLDCEVFGAEAELVEMRRLLDSVSGDWTPDIILANEDQATYSLLACGHPLAKKVPVVFGGVNYPNQNLLRQHPNVTGFHDRIDIMANIGVVKDFFGENIDLFTILDSTYLDKQIREDVYHQVKDHKVTGFSKDSSTKRSHLLPTRKKEGYTALFAVSARANMDGGGLLWALRGFNTQKCYIQLKRDFTTVNIGNICTGPSITAINESFGFGEKLLGGYFTTLPIQVEEEVGAAARILRGVKPSEIPITDSRKEYAVDWKVMTGLKLTTKDIPGKYTIINIPLQEKYPIAWWLSITVFVLSVAALIVWLFLLYRREFKRKRHALHALADEKQTLALAIEGSDTYAWKFEDDHFIFENAFWASQGVAPKTLLFEEMLTFFHPESQQSVLSNWDKNRVRKRIAQMRCDFNGQGYFWWEFRYTTVRLDDGTCKTAGLLLNIQDVKDREQELDDARKLAEKAELKESFLANISHEIRTPLNAIVGFSNILTSGVELDPEDKQLYIDMINRNNELLLKLFSDILELARIESGSMSFDFSDCMVSELIDNIYATHQMLVPKHLEFCKQADEAPVQIHVDALRLTQVITNFLNNAGKFTEKGYIKLGYTYLPDTEQVCIFVEDSGQGIPAGEQKAIFSRFYKRSEFSQGTGLGLSICQVIIEKLQGRISLWSEPGKGSRFMILLPCTIHEK